MMNFQQYISHFGFQPTSLEEWKEAKKSYRKYYQKKYSKNYRKEFKRVEILFAKKEFEKLNNVAVSFSEKPTTFIRKSSLAYMESEIHLPINENIEEVKMLIRKSSNNINQLVHFSHAQKNISEKRLIQIIEQVNRLETIVNTLFASPKIIFKPIHLISNLNANQNDV